MKIPFMLGFMLFALIPAQAQAPHNSPIPARTYLEQIKSPVIPEIALIMPLESLELPVRDRIRLAAEKYGISYKWLLNVLICESGLKNEARGKAGEIGIAQFMPATFYSFAKIKGLENPNILNEDQQIDLTAWAFAEGLSYHWTCNYGRR